MINAMTQVMNFLKSFESDEQRNDLITSSDEVDVIDLGSKVYNSKFASPSVQRIGDVDDKYTTISFRAEKVKVTLTRNYFGVSNNKEVGLKIFDYFLNKESENL